MSATNYCEKLNARADQKARARKNQEKENAFVLEMALKTDAGEKVLVAAMDRMFTQGKWEIPDDAIVGIYAAKIQYCEAQIKSLVELVKTLSAELRGQPIKAGERIDALAAAKKKGKK